MKQDDLSDVICVVRSDGPNTLACSGARCGLPPTTHTRFSFSFRFFSFVWFGLLMFCCRGRDLGLVFFRLRGSMAYGHA